MHIYTRIFISPKTGSQKTKQEKKQKNTKERTRQERARQYQQQHTQWTRFKQNTDCTNGLESTRRRTCTQ